MKIRLFLASMITLLPAAASATQGMEDRIERARLRFEKFVNDGESLKPNEYFLISLKRPIRPWDLDRLKNEYSIDLSSAHFCTARGVLTVGLNSDDTVENHINSKDLIAMVGGRKRYISSQDLGNDLAPNDPKLCGFTGVIAADSVKAFSTEQHINITAIEIEDQKRSHFAVNYNLTNSSE